jgi:hypothetical protein
MGKSLLSSNHGKSGLMAPFLILVAKTLYVSNLASEAEDVVKDLGEDFD